MEVSLAIAPNEVDASLHIAVTEDLNTLVCKQRILEPLKGAAVSSHVSPEKVSGQGGIAIRLRISVREIEIIQSKTVSVGVLPVDHWCLLILAGAGGNAMTKLDQDGVLGKIVCKSRLATKRDLAAAGDGCLLLVCTG